MNKKQKEIAILLLTTSLLLSLFSCSKYDRTEINKMLVSDDKNNIMEAIYQIGEKKDSFYNDKLLELAYDPRVSHLRKYLGMSIHYGCIVALKKITNKIPPNKMSYEVDTQNIVFYRQLLGKTEKQTTKSTENQKVLSESEKEYFNKYDILDSDSVLIEGKLRIYGKTNQMKKVFNEPMRKVVESEYCVSFFSDDEQTKTYYYYGNTVFEIYKDSFALGLIDFRSTDKQVVTPKIVLNKSTRLNDLENIFPKSYKIRYSIKNEKSKPRIVVPLLVCKECDDKFFLIFEDNKLVEIENHMDC